MIPADSAENSPPVDSQIRRVSDIFRHPRYCCMFGKKKKYSLNFEIVEDPRFFLKRFVLTVEIYGVTEFRCEVVKKLWVDRTTRKPIS